jgi:HEAT repeat protein
MPDDELVYFEFGDPLDPDMPLESELRWILADFDARKDAFNALSRSQSVGLMIDWLAQAQDDPAALKTLIRAIGFLRFPSSARALEPYLAHPAVEIQAETILALGRIGALESLPKIERFLDSPDVSLRRAAIVALSRSLDDAVFDRLEAAAGGNPELRLIVRQGRRRLAAAKAKDLETFTNIVLETEEFEDLIPLTEYAWRFIVQIAQDRTRDDVVRLRALSVIRTTWMRRADTGLAQILADRTNPPEIVLQAAIAAGPCRAESAVGSLIMLLTSEPLPFKTIAIRSLGQIGSADAFDTMLASWQHLEPLRSEIRLAIRRLCKVPGEAVVDLLRANEHWAPRVTYFITGDLRLIEGYTHGLVDDELRSSNAMARRDALVIVAYLGDSSERPKLEALTKDQDLSVRDLARRAIALKPAAPRV